MTTAVATMTADELLQLPHDRWRYELVEGELRRMSPAGRQHGRIAVNMTLRLASYVKQHALGVVYAAETGFILRRDPDTVRAPDVAFVSTTAEARASSDSAYFPGPPDLAVEVVSPGDTFTQVEEKVFLWLAAGTQAVVVLDPSRRRASVYRAKDDIRQLADDETLDLSFVVPGFQVAVADLFE